uniref:Receptor-like serine/threonine-protein kinase ALE2 isoform X4 n=1 Tax=Populus alba TaxID=43335 RepID=A0A4V6XX10_POPAL|nr:receptor-like serine/threonine-protein kinase ALE2 isoform X4 [Populus alba]
MSVKTVSLAIYIIEEGLPKVFESLVLDVMGLVMVPPILQLLGKLSAIGFFFTVQGSTAIFSDIPPIEGTPGPQLQPFRSSVPASESLSTGSNLHPPLALPPLTSAPVPQTITGHVPSYSPSPLIVTKPHNRAPPPLISQGHVPSLSPSFSAISPTYNTAPPPTLNQGHEPAKPPNAHRREAAVRQTPVSASSAPAAAPSRQSPENSPVSQSNAPEASSLSTHKKDVSFSGAPVPNAVSPAASPSRNSKENQPAAPSIAPETMPSVPVVSPMGAMPQNSSATHPVMPGESPAILSGPNVPHPSAPTPSIDDKKDEIPVSAPPNETPTPLSPMSHFPAKGSFSGVAPSTHNAMRHSNDSPISPSSLPKTPLDKQHHSSAPSPSIPFHKQNHESSRISDSAPASSNPAFPPSSKQQGPVMPPSFLPTSRHKQYAFSPLGTPDSSNNASHYRYPKPVIIVSPTPSPTQTAASGWTKMPALSPKASPSGFSSRTPKMPPLPPLHTLPPPPPNEDCSTTVCTEPYTNTPPGSPCRCVLPMQVGLGVSVALYTFFPLVSELAQEIAADFGKKQVVINPSFFGDYEVLYVRYLGLPPPPPMAPFGIAIIDDGPYSGNDNNAGMIKPLGVDVHKRKRKDGLAGGIIAIIAVSGSVALVLLSAVALALLFKHRDHASQPASVLQPLPPSVVKPSGIAGSLIGSGLSSASLSFASSIPAVAKVAAIASMCVQPEVSHRPFMSEVVQALKLVSNECDEAKELDSRSSSQDLSIYMDAEVSVSGQLRDSLGSQALVHNYDSEPDIERGLVDSYFFSASDGCGRQGSGSLRRCSSGPLKTGRGRELFQRMRLTGESESERGTIFKMWPGSH